MVSFVSSVFYHDKKIQDKEQNKTQSLRGLLSGPLNFDVDFRGAAGQGTSYLGLKQGCGTAGPLTACSSPGAGVQARPHCQVSVPKARALWSRHTQSHH